MKDKVILVDCDGVLMDWEYAFTVWMERHSEYSNGTLDKGEYDIGKRYGITKKEKERLVRFFNESAAIGYLPPLRDAMYYVDLLHRKHGYVFHMITSLSKDPDAQRLREMNAKKLFGETTFEKFVFLDTGADKDEALEEYRDTGCYWVEDKPENVDVGISAGLKGVLVAHDHNSEYEGSATRVQNWKEIYEMIIG